MCNQQRHGSPSQIWENLRKDMPLRRKVYLTLRNYWTRVRKRSTCCGNYGEPGC